MKLHLLAASALVAVATPALAQGVDSRHSPYPASAYSGYTGNASGFSVTHDRPALAYRYSGQHVVGPQERLVTQHYYRQAPNPFYGYSY